MDAPRFERLAVLGVGLIGGSLGMAMRARRLVGEVVAYSRTAATRDLAVRLGAADRAAASPAECVAGADLVYLAAPVASLVPLLRSIAPVLRPGALVTDAGSSKAEVVTAAAAVELGTAVFIGGHPMAGSERMGVAAARADLFAGATYVLTPTAATPAAATERLAALVHALGARPLILPPDLHDEAVAAVSHVPHLAAVAAMLLTAARQDQGQPVYALAAGGWRSATRVAAGGARLWREILASNRAAVVQAIDEYQDQLYSLREALANGADDRLEALLESAREHKLQATGSSTDG
ncbi:MAG: prephenate dehydrogenase/arogenate dehydrogenase family protein [Fimbriimonadaceae bacterium]|nr:prephenate dehydrogenase/arogenate dehydrogenase family protein [Fimbriimonadaceae bacterium]